MPSLIGNYSITSTNSSTLNSDSIATANALSISVATATKDLLLPAIDTKAPRNNPIFTGTVQGITANMITATADDGTTSNVQNELNSIYNMTARDVPSDGSPGGGPSNVQTDISIMKAAISQKAEINNPTFSGTVNGITASMIRSTIPAGQTSRTVQQDIDGIKTQMLTDSNSVVNKVDKVDSQMQGDVVISPKTSEGLETTLSINSTGTSGNNFSTLYLNNAGQNGKLFFNTPIVGLVLSTTGAPIRLSPNNNEALVVNNDKSCLLGGDVTVTGNMKNKIQLSNNFPSNAISSVISENTSATGYARLQLQTPSNVAYMQMGKSEGLLVSTETALPMMFSPNKSEAMRLNANGNASFRKDVEVTGLATSGNIWIERSMNNAQTYTYADSIAFADKPNYTGWKVLFFHNNSIISDRGPSIYVGPTASTPYWNSVTPRVFNIRKSGIYSIKANIFAEFQTARYDSSLSLRICFLPPGATLGNEKFQNYENKTHLAWRSFETLNIEDTFPCAAGTLVWVEFKATSMSSTTSPIIFTAGDSTLRLHLVN